MHYADFHCSVIVNIEEYYIFTNYKEKIYILLLLENSLNITRPKIIFRVNSTSKSYISERYSQYYKKIMLINIELFMRSEDEPKRQQREQKK